MNENFIEDLALETHVSSIVDYLQYFKTCSFRGCTVFGREDLLLIRTEDYVIYESVINRTVPFEREHCKDSDKGEKQVAYPTDNHTRMVHARSF